MRLSWSFQWFPEKWLLKGFQLQIQYGASGEFADFGGLWEPPASAAHRFSVMVCNPNLCTQTSNGHCCHLQVHGLQPSQKVQFRVAAVASEVIMSSNPAMAHAAPSTLFAIASRNSTTRRKPRFTVVPANGATVSWAHAKQACEAAGMELAAPRNSHDIDLIVNAAATPDMIWIGASCTGSCATRNKFKFKRMSRTRRVLPWLYGHPTSGASHCPNSL